MLRNLQPVEKQWLDPDGRLEVHSVFYTLQGEGPFAGRPAVFVRLAGCNLSSVCKGCDTDYTSTRVVQYPEGILKRVDAAFPLYGRGLVVLTGGEPFRQNIAPFVNLALLRYDVQIETNGTLDVPGAVLAIAGHVAITVCSPKTPAVTPGKQWCHYWKFILQADQVDETDGLPSSSLESGLRPYRPEMLDWRERVFVQPMDEQDPDKNRRNTQAAVRSCLKFGYRLCLQLHKLPGVDLP